MEELELGPEGRWDFPSAPRLSLPSQGRGLIPSCWSRSLEGLGPGWLVPFKHVFFPLLATEGSVLKWGARAQQRSHALPARAPTVLLKLSLGSRSPYPSQLVTAPTTLARPWDHSAGREGPTWTLSAFQEVSHGAAGVWAASGPPLQ